LTNLFSLIIFKIKPTHFFSFAHLDLQMLKHQSLFMYSPRSYLDLDPSIHSNLFHVMHLLDILTCLSTLNIAINESTYLLH
jgi:hypothetical protein